MKNKMFEEMSEEGRTRIIHSLLDTLLRFLKGKSGSQKCLDTLLAKMTTVLKGQALDVRPVKHKTEAVITVDTSTSKGNVYSFASFKKRRKEDKDKPKA